MAESGNPRERAAILVIRVAGTAVVVLMVALLFIFPSRPVHRNLAGLTSPILGLELASAPEHVFDILGRPGEPARADAVRRTDLGNRIDFLFMVAYPALFVGIAMLLAAHGALSRGMLALMITFAIGMLVGDALENRELLYLSSATDPAAMAPSLARLQRFTHVKWNAIFGASAILALGVSQELGWWRWSWVAFLLAALAGFSASLGYLPGIEWGMYLLAVAWVVAYAHAWRAG